MRAAGLLERLRSLFGGADTLGDGTSRALFESDDQRHVDQTWNVRGIIQQLEEQDATSVVAGCIEVLGLEAVKERLGSQWPALQDRVLALAQDTLDRLLGPQDIYTVTDDAFFHICFASGDEVLARAQVKRISADIERKILAEIEGTGDEVTVETFVAQVPFAPAKGAGDPLASLHRSLLQIRDAVGAKAIEQHRSPALRFSSVLFQPLWSNRDFGQTKNRCVLDTLAGSAALEHLEGLQQLDEMIGALATLDSVLFAKSIEALHQALGVNKRTTIVVPVHFQTLATTQPQFLEIAAVLPTSYRRLVLLDVIGVPTAATSGDLLAALQTARSITDRTVLQMSPTDPRMIKEVRNLLWGVSLGLSGLDHGDPLIAREIKRFAIKSAEHGLYGFAYGANTIGKAFWVAESGFDYIGGSAVASTVPAPRPNTYFKPLFGDATPKTSRDPKADLRQHPRFEPVDPNSTVTLPSGRRYDCRVSNASSSGAVVICSASVNPHEYLIMGSIPAQVIRTTKLGFAVRFLEVQPRSAVEIALRTPPSNDKVLTTFAHVGFAVAGSIQSQLPADDA